MSYVCTPSESRKRTADLAGLSVPCWVLGDVEERVRRSLVNQDVKMGAMRIRQDIADSKVARLGEEMEDLSRQHNKDCLVVSGAGKEKNLHFLLLHFMLIQPLFLQMSQLQRKTKPRRKVQQYFAEQRMQRFRWKLIGLSTPELTDSDHNPSL